MTYAERAKMMLARIEAEKAPLRAEIRQLTDDVLAATAPGTPASDRYFLERLEAAIERLVEDGPPDRGSSHTLMRFSHPFGKRTAVATDYGNVVVDGPVGRRWLEEYVNYLEVEVDRLMQDDPSREVGTLPLKSYRDWCAEQERSAA